MHRLPEHSADGATARIPFAVPEISGEAQEAAGRVLSSGWLTTGPEVSSFEDEFAASVQAQHAVAVSSCTAAIEIALRALRLPAGAAVLTPTMTFCGAVNAIVHAGLRPVLADLDERTLMPSPETVATAVHAAGPVDAMVALHFAGHPAPVSELAEAVAIPRDRVVEDAAHGLGADLGGVPVGADAAAACFSFYATKNLPIGEGGMLTTDAEGIAAAARTLRLHGMSHDAWRRYLPGGTPTYTVDTIGIKANMGDLQAAIGRAQLHHLPAWQERRKAIAARYDRGLADVPGILLPARPAVGGHAWHLYVIRVRDEDARNQLMAALSEAGVDTSIHFTPVHHLPAYQRLVGRATLGRLPSADAVAGQILSLPLYPSLTDEQVDRVCDVIASHMRTSRPPGTIDLRAGVIDLGTGVQRRHEPALAVRPEAARAADRARRCLIVGAGEAGASLARVLPATGSDALQPIGFLDDDPRLHGELVAGLPVLGGANALDLVVEGHEVDVVIVAIPSLPPPAISALARRAAEAPVSHVRYVESFGADRAREVTLGDIRRVGLHYLIGRNEAAMVGPGASSMLRGRRILVTGAGGSIGSELCRQINACEPAALYLVDHDESNLHALQLELKGHGLLDDDQIVIADVRDTFRMRNLFETLRPDVVFHAAAHKHLPLLERHPCEAVKSNVLAVRNVVWAALAAGVDRCILVSTDKAADPTSILGVTKRLGEMILQAHAGGSTRFASVRFGNVLGSRGSLLSSLACQLERGQALTVTHPAATRFFMTIEEAVGLVTEAAHMANEGEIFVLDMGEPVNILELVRRFALSRDHDAETLEIRYTGLRPGEKLHESLFSADEQRLSTEHPRIWSTAIGRPDLIDFDILLDELAEAAAADDDALVRRHLATLVPAFRPPAPQRPGAQVEAPYPDDF